MSFKIQARVSPLGKKTITRQAKSVLWQLSDMANDEGVCFPSQDLLAYRTMLGQTALREALNWLQEHQLIKVDRRQTGGRRFSDQYTLNVVKITEMFIIETGRAPTAELPADLKVNPQNPRVDSLADPQNPISEPSESEGCYKEESIKINYQNNIQTASVNFVSNEIEAWLSASPLKGINTNNPEFIKAHDLGICLQDMQDAFGYMQANNKGNSWSYFVKTLLSRVTDRLSNHVDTLPVKETKTTAKVKAKAVDQKIEAGIALLESNGVDDKKLIHDFMAVRESKNAGVLTQSALDIWLEQAKNNGLPWCIKSIISWCTGNDRFTFHGPMAAASVGGVKPNEHQKMEALKSQIKTDIENRQKPQTQEPRKPRPSVSKVLEQALARSQTAAFL